MNTPSEPGPISPELVLVDPSLAELVRSADPAPEAAVRQVRRVEPPEPEDAERWADELLLFLAPPAQDQPYAWHADETAAPVAAPPVEEAAQAPAAEPEHRRRRRTVTPLRVGGVVIAVLVLAGAGTTLGALISQSPGGTTRAEVDPALSTRAGTTSAAAATPGTTSAPTGSTAASTPQPRIVAWAPAPGAAAYDVALYEGSRRIFFERTPQTRLTLPARWRYEGRTERLDPGVYRWYVWPVAKGSDKAGRRPVVQAKLTIPAG